MNKEHCIDICNGLLRGEQSAVATYAKAIADYRDEGAPLELQDILDDHREAVLVLTENVRSMGGQPSTDSGLWGDFAKGVQSTADAIGRDTALASLKTGEKAGQHDYENALEDSDVMPECKELIRDTLLPTVVDHIRVLDTLTASR